MDIVEICDVAIDAEVPIVRKVEKLQEAASAKGVSGEAISAKGKVSLKLVAASVDAILGKAHHTCLSSQHEMSKGLSSYASSLPTSRKVRSVANIVHECGVSHGPRREVSMMFHKTVWR